MAGGLWFGLTILLSAFLLFQVQPIVARAILPWFGGSAAIWTTCLLFFQCVLLLGYLYAHWLHRYVRPRLQAIVHIALLAASLAVLPILPSAKWKPIGGEDPTLRILLLLAATVGLPYFLLSTTGPLLQAWYARHKGAIPYRLYALSNAGSMFALISYPVLVEPVLGTRLQAVSWSWAYLAFATICGLTALLGRGSGETPVEVVDAPPPSARTYFFWIALPAGASALLLGITNHLTQNIAAIPFLWILPLTLYLLTFILCFEGTRWYRRTFFLRLFALAAASMAYALAPDNLNLPMKIAAPLFTAGLFICCMVCHGELARMKPHLRWLTQFYVMISLGGAIGGIFVALIAPHIFRGFYELPVGLAACTLLVLAVLRADPGSGLGGRWMRLQPLVALALALGIAASLVFGIYQRGVGVRLLVRNFYGGLKVTDRLDEDSNQPERRLTHGTIMHGLQFLNPDWQNRPTTYYGPESGVGLAILQAQTNGAIRVGVIGLGAGTLAAYGRAGDSYRFYEINPAVVSIARTQFTFLTKSQAHIEVSLGDARLSLEREPIQHFDVLAVDAFSSDAIPVHLLTREAFGLYFRHLNPNGVLAVHVSNRYLDLRPVVDTAAQFFGKASRTVESDAGDNEISTASWMLVSTGGPAAKPERRIRMWTDDYSNLLQLLK